MSGVNRIEVVGELAKKITGLPVADQIRFLGNLGLLRTEDMNWKNQQQGGTGLETRIPIRGESTTPVPGK